MAIATGTTGTISPDGSNMPGPVFRARTYQGYEGLIRLYAVPSIGEIPLQDLHPLHLQSLYTSDERPDPPDLRRHRVEPSPRTHPGVRTSRRMGIARSLPCHRCSDPRGLDDPSLRSSIPHSPCASSPPHGASHRTTGSRSRSQPGMRRGEILGLRWRDLDADFSVAHVRRTLQSTTSGLVFEDPKTRRSRRAVALPAFLHPYLTCRLREGCTHTRTYYDDKRPHIPYQDDYLFASAALAGDDGLVSCFAPWVGPGSPSDHAPIVAVFEV